jgi:hypothetical protein
VVDGDRQRRFAQAVDRRTQRGELGRIAVVAGEKNDAADQRMHQALTLKARQFEAGNIDHQGAMREFVHSFSRMTKATA